MHKCICNFVYLDDGEEAPPKAKKRKTAPKKKAATKKRKPAKAASRAGPKRVKLFTASEFMLSPKLQAEQRAPRYPRLYERMQLGWRE